MNFEGHEDMFVKPVDEQSDLFAFQYDFALEGKALEDGRSENVIHETAEGDLIIEGYAAVFEGTDREGENFLPGSFQRGIKAFLGGQNALCFNHKKDHVLGEVLDLREEEGKGLWMKARVDHQPESSPLRWIFNAVKKGSMKGLSCGGFFKRKLTEAGYRIADMDFTEMSITGVAVHPGTKFAVVAGKALESAEPAPVVEDAEDFTEEEYSQLELAVEHLAGSVADLRPEVTPEPETAV